MADSSTSKTTTNADMDAEIQRMLLDKELATQEEIDQCLRIWEELVEGDDPRTLSQICIAQGIVTASQMDRLRQTLEASRNQQIPGFQLLAKIGSGAMATVFKARQIRLNRIVAIKVLPQRLSQDADYVERFYREGEVAAKLNHPNIVQAIDIGEANGYHYFVMEYVEGHTVYDVLTRGEVYSETDALTIGIQIARALEHAHEHGLVHRDVKPKNIMITTEGVAKLADMGLARAVADTQAAQAEAGLLFGTPYYISPEQIIGKQDVDFRADIYGLGATLYHMVTGRPPFEGKDAKEVMSKHLKEKLVSPDKYNIDLSFGLCKVIRHMMTKHRERRYESTSEMLQDLESVDFLLEADTSHDSSAGSTAFKTAMLESPRDKAPAKAPAPRPAPAPPADQHKFAAQPTVPAPVTHTRHEPTFNNVTWVLLVIAIVSVLLNLLLLATRL